ncbi:hypothetical protein EV193_101141 [Herbihabitans rhizosphaerae]|uniref:Uncharacterized protein n=1 Tax=Herbihabitans rhizosphaerae TaxID=1872711 RepID=A0A4Q7L4X7_9PSEU|nr:hypothetical protein [Herbihabitans rhizosphaerae]RZS44266.1 hypothetical protein EV193_101141 [Herbihabitans rhizosphaerae]
MTGHWAVVIEENTNRGDYMQWRVTHTSAAMPYEHAVGAAKETAALYQPQHPTLQQGRTVYHSGSDTWMVLVEGATSNHHFRVSVVEVVAQYDKAGRLTYPLS